MAGIRISRVISGGGLTLAGEATRSPDQVTAIGPVPLAVGKAGTLTTRTDANTGTITLAADHGITTGQIVDVYWATGMKFNVTVGTVSGTSVPIDLGSGDDLPSTSTAVVVAPRVEVTVSMVTAMAAVLALHAEREDANSTAKAHVDLWDESISIGAVGLEGNLPRVYDMTLFGAYFSELNPADGTATVTFWVSNGSSTETADFYAIIGQDSTP